MLDGQEAIMHKTSYTVTIPDGQNTHPAAIDCSDVSQIAVQVPATFDGTTLTIESGTTDQVHAGVIPAMVITVTVDKVCVIDEWLMAQFRALRYVWMVSDAAQSGSDCVVAYVLTRD